jgi:hypothetical protein
MNLCCKVNPTKTCRTCEGKFCAEHVYQEIQSYTRDVKSIQCFSCYRSEVSAILKEPRVGMTMKELYLKLREVCPKGYMSVSATINDHNPGHRMYTTEWQVYHESHRTIRGTTPELVLASFIAEISGEPDPQVTSLDKIDV